MRQGQRILRSTAQSGTILSQGDRQPFLPRVRRLAAGVCRPLTGGGHDPFSVGQSEFGYAQGGGGTVWRESRRLVVESVYRTLHPQARQLAEPSRNRDQPVFPAMPGPTPHRRPRLSAARNSGLGRSHESPSSSDSMVLYSQESSAYLWLHNHTVTVQATSRGIQSSITRTESGECNTQSNPWGPIGNASTGVRTRPSGPGG